MNSNQHPTLTGEGTFTVFGSPGGAILPAA